MLKKKYLDFLQKQVREIFPDKNLKFFIFGSSVEKENFRDVDLGIMGEFDEKLLSRLQAVLEESTFPYLVHVVNFNKTKEDFKNFVLNQKLIWL